jgi:hypothetical protein
MNALPIPLKTGYRAMGNSFEAGLRNEGDEPIQAVDLQKILKEIEHARSTCGSTPPSDHQLANNPSGSARKHLPELELEERHAQARSAARSQDETLSKTNSSQCVESKNLAHANYCFPAQSPLQSEAKPQ